MRKPIPRCFLNRSEPLIDKLPENGGDQFSPLWVNIVGGRRGLLLFSTPQAAQEYTEKADAGEHLSVVFGTLEQIKELLDEQMACGPTLVICDRDPASSSYYAADAGAMMAELDGARDGVAVEFALHTGDGLRLPPGKQPS